VPPYSRGATCGLFVGVPLFLQISSHTLEARDASTKEEEPIVGSSSLLGRTCRSVQTVSSTPSKKARSPTSFERSSIRSDRCSRTHVAAIGVAASASS
jgi:hypothetical protein